MLQHDVAIIAAQDGRDPDPHKDKGITGAEMRWTVSGPAGAAQFIIFTQWYLPEVQKELDAKYKDHDHCRPIAADLAYHSRAPRFATQTKLPYCPLISGGPCYYQGSSQGAQKLFQDMLTHGSDVIWEVLEMYYAKISEGGPHHDKTTAND